MDYDYDVVIIGAGPVGGYTARLLCERGLSCSDGRRAQ